MKVCLEMALSPNGYIAREDGQEDWLSSDNWKDFLKRALETNNIVMGRQTYELVTKLYPKYNFDDVVCEHKIIVSNTLKNNFNDKYIVLKTPEEAIEYIRAKKCSELLLIGGGKLNKSFLEKKLVDYISVTFEPYVIGSGRTFLKEGNYEFKLKLEKSRVISGDRVKIEYEVVK